MELKTLMIKEFPSWVWVASDPIGFSFPARPGSIDSTLVAGNTCGPARVKRLRRALRGGSKTASLGDPEMANSSEDELR